MGVGIDENRLHKWLQVYKLTSHFISAYCAVTAMLAAGAGQPPEK